MAASVLGICSGLLLGFLALVYLFLTIDSPTLGQAYAAVYWLRFYLAELTLTCLLAGTSLGVGGILLLYRKWFARWLLAGGAVAAVLAASIPYAAALMADDVTSDVVADVSFSGTSAFVIGLTAAMVLMPLASSIFGFQPSTRRYCNGFRPGARPRE